MRYAFEHDFCSSMIFNRVLFFECRFLYLANLRWKHMYRYISGMRFYVWLLCVGLNDKNQLIFFDLDFSITLLALRNTVATPLYENVIYFIKCNVYQYHRLCYNSTTEFDCNVVPGYI